MQFDSSIGEFKVFASKTILREPLFARIMIEFKKVVPLGCCFFLFGGKIFVLFKNVLKFFYFVF